MFSQLKTTLIKHWHRFHWPWFSLYGYFVLPLFVYWFQWLLKLFFGHADSQLLTCSFLL